MTFMLRSTLACRWEQFLFRPLIGCVAGDHIRIAGKAYPMPQHGFAQGLRFDVVRQAEQTCLLVAEDSSETRAMYPFPFRLEVGYAVSRDTLSIESTVINTGKGMMPVSFGYHPGFRWPLEPELAKSDHEIGFPDDDAIIVVRPLEALLGSERSRISLPASVLALDEAEFARGAMIVLAPQSRLVHFGSKFGKLSIDVGFEGLTNLGIWMRPEGNFICIEPWQGYADPHGFNGDFLNKPGLDLIGEKRCKKYSLSIRLKDRPLSGQG